MDELLRALRCFIVTDLKEIVEARIGDWRNLPTIPLLWETAQQVRREYRCEQKIDDFELFDLMHNELMRSIELFDPHRPPRYGEPGRQPIQKRFRIYFRDGFRRRLKRFKKDTDNGRHGSDQFRGPRSDLAPLAPSTITLERKRLLVQTALTYLSLQERELIKAKFWERMPYRSIAMYRCYGCKNGRQVKYMVEGILDRLRDIITQLLHLDTELSKQRYPRAQAHQPLWYG